MRMQKMMGLALAAMLAMGLAAGPAAADVPPWALIGNNLDLDELAAALALPIVTGGQGPNAIKATQGDVIVLDDSAITLATVTNAASTTIVLKVDAISGDPNAPLVGGDSWQSDSFECRLTGRETTTFLIVPAGQGSILYVECTDPSAQARNQVVALKAQNGILWVAAADANGTVLGSDLIFGDAVVIDLVAGQAFSFGAIPFQAGQGFNDGDKIFRFDGSEYVQWPNVVTTNFIAPSAGGQGVVIEAELILFTLDGTTGNPTPPRVGLGGLAYDDDENFFDFQHEFDCFDIVRLADMSLNFLQAFNGGSLSGHLQLVPQPLATANDVHDAAYGDANNSRRRPVHGWIVQSVRPTAPFVAPGQPNPLQGNAFAVGNNAAWGRPLNQGRDTLLPFLQDLPPVLDADPLL